MKKISITLITLSIHSLILSADPPTPSPDKSSTKTSADIKVGEKTKTIKVINRINDTKVVSKLYKLKHVDPWDIKPFLEGAVRARRINRSRTGVECIKYNDGTGAVLISAERYRFSKDQKGGMSIDELVKNLDQPRGEIVDGMETMVYFPKFRSAQAIANMINNVGLQKEGDETELLSGESKAVADQNLNAVAIYATPSELKNVKKMLKIYDKGLNQVTLSYKVYELLQENGELIGNDYIAWKNGPGVDLFSIGGKFTKGGNTKFVKFNPKWNSSFIDFLVAKKKAVLLTSGAAVLINRKKYSNVQSKPTSKRLPNGFSIQVMPSINTKTTTLDMKVSYKSAIGRSSTSSKVQVANDGGKVILGGMEKKADISSSTSPGMWEWLFGSDSDASKTSKVITVIECSLDKPEQGIPPEAKKVIDEVKKELGID